MTKKEMLAIEEKIESHLEMSEDPLELAELLILKFPQYSYTGIAYRAVMIWEKGIPFEPRLVRPGTSWSLNPEGREKFIYDMEAEGPASMVVKIDAHIFGISLVRLIKEKFPHLESDIGWSRMMGEDEIIALEIMDILSTKEVVNE